MPAGRSGLSWFTLLLAGSAVALQQQPQDGASLPPSPSPPRQYASPHEKPILQPHTVKHNTNARLHQAGQSQPQRVEVPQQKFRDTLQYDPDIHHHHTNNQNRNTNTKRSASSDDERAIATLAPTDASAEGGHAAVRAPHPARSASARLSSTPARARNLRDWEVEDFVLLATVDGKIHARDRKTGTRDKWVFTPTDERPIVDTKYHKINESDRGDIDGKIIEDEWLWIVEPTQDGALFVYSAEGKGGVQKLGVTVKQLADEMTAHASDDPAVVYTAEKKSTLYVVNAANGKLVKEFSASSATAGVVDSCKPVSSLGSLDDEACDSDSNSQFTIARIDYTVAIHNQTTLAPICTIRYSEWTPNNKDRDLREQYRSTMDNTYVYSAHDGRTMTFKEVDGRIVAMDEKPFSQTTLRNKLPAPVVKVFDVARHSDEDPKEASLVVLPQPSTRPLNLLDGQGLNLQDKLFINCTESGGWYAMSEEQFPFVAAFAPEAKCYSHSNSPDDELAAWEKKPLPRKSELVGMHSLSEYADDFQPPLLSLPAPSMEPVPVVPAQPLMPVEGGGKVNENLQTGMRIVSSQSSWASSSVRDTIILFLVLVLSLMWLKPGWASQLQRWFAQLREMGSLPLPAHVNSPAGPPDTPAPEEETRKVRFTDPEGTAPGEEHDASAPPPTAPGEDLDAPNVAIGDDASEAGEVKKKKAHRGQRGGKNHRKKKNKSSRESEPEECLTEKLGKQFDTDHSMQPDDPAVPYSDFADDVSATVRLNNLEIRKDRVLGYGSGGTTVYEGSFEGRDVAVKQMLPQYFALASQEVQLLQQSDDHPNVIRYFCHQKDPNFLYIAVELCRASLFDLYKDGGAMTSLTDEQMALAAKINANVPDALHQLAMGLQHLHSLRIIHRDIKPQNILIAYPKRNQADRPRLVISDFGLCKTLPDNASTLMGTTGNAGTIGWKAPELIMNPRGSDNGLSSQSQNADSSSSTEAVASGVKRAVDIFSLGCVFFYVLTNGAHPFDSGSEMWTVMRELNIKRNAHNFAKLQNLGDDAAEPMHLVPWMLSPSPEMRPTARQVVHHPFFWSAEMRLAFLCDVSDHFEREVREPPSEDLLALESYASEVIGDKRGWSPNSKVAAPADFLAKLDRKFVDTLGKQRKYQGNKMLDLLRALRNKKNHYADMAEDVKQRVGELPGGYLAYWTSRFPGLLIACYRVIGKCGLEGDPRFRRYMGTG